MESCAGAESCSHDQSDGERLAFQGPEVAQQFTVEHGHALSPSSEHAWHRHCPMDTVGDVVRSRGYIIEADALHTHALLLGRLCQGHHRHGPVVSATSDQ